MVHTGGMDPETRAWLQERIDGPLAAGMGIAWFAAYELAGALEPVTHQPEPWYGVALGVVFLGLVAATVAGLIAQRRWGLVVSVAAAGFFVALSVACPVSGHHPFGPWWFGQMACALGVLGGSVGALRWSTRTQSSEASDAPEASDPTEPPLVSAGDAASRG